MEVKIGKPKAPKPTDPRVTASAQTKSNQDTAKYQAALNAVNQVTPTGSLTYTQDKWPDGTPKYTATTTLSPQYQKIADALAGGAGTLATNLQSQAGQPLDWSQQQGFLNDLTDQNLDPVWERNMESQRTQLINQGLMPGSEGYRRAMDSFQRSRSSAYNDARLNNYSTALQSQLALRNQPINELSAFLSGSQVSPSFTATSQTGVAGTDIIGAIQGADAMRANSYNQQMNQWNNTFGGLFSLGGSAMKAFSDKRLKKDVRSTGEKVAGIPIKTFGWKGKQGRDVGVLAQDVEKKYPHLVEMDPSGYRKVNYGGLMRIGAKGRAA